MSALTLVFSLMFGALASSATTKCGPTFGIDIYSPKAAIKNARSVQALQGDAYVKKASEVLGLELNELQVRALLIAREWPLYDFQRKKRYLRETGFDAASIRTIFTEGLMEPTNPNNRERLRLLDDLKMSTEEAGSISSYIQLAFESFNNPLRGFAQMTYEAASKINLLNSALSKLPIFQGYVFRAARFGPNFDRQDVLRIYKVGSTVREDSFISASRDASIMKHYYSERSESPIQFTILSRFGRDVSYFQAGTKMADEVEILFLSGSNFYVKDVRDDGKVIHISMEERPSSRTPIDLNPFPKYGPNFEEQNIKAAQTREEFVTHYRIPEEVALKVEETLTFRTFPGSPIENNDFDNFVVRYRLPIGRKKVFMAVSTYSFQRIFHMSVASVKTGTRFSPKFSIIATTNEIKTRELEDYVLLEILGETIDFSNLLSNHWIHRPATEVLLKAQELQVENVTKTEFGWKILAR